LFKVFMAPEAELIPRLRDVLYSGQVTEGEPVYEFERRFGDLVEQKNVLSFYSGTAALHTALILAGVSPGDDVVTTAMTAEPSNMAIRHAGAHIVWADVDPRNGNVTGATIEASLTPRTRAILVVHYGGIPAPIASIRLIAEQYRIPVIEDAAHALGARYGGVPIGAHSEFVMYSLQAVKHLNTVDGGMLVCRAADDADRGRLVRWFGIDRHTPRTVVDVETVGYKYHMNNVTATIGLVQLDHIGAVLGRHIQNGRFFDRALVGIDGLETCAWDAQAEPSYWFYTVLAERRDDLSRALSSRGIENGLVHRRNDLHRVFAGSRRDLPGLDEFWGRMLHLPCGWWVSSDDRERMGEAIRKGW
jgi:dTDP-4-amino-4,6-dideoxygalactose transaminase